MEEGRPSDKSICCRTRSRSEENAAVLSFWGAACCGYQKLSTAAFPSERERVLHPIFVETKRPISPYSTLQTFRS